MIVPNLAAQPRLNTRPVVVLSVAALVLAAVLGAVNLRLYLATNRTLAEQIRQLETLRNREAALESELSTHLAALEGVPWKGLSARVRTVNLLLSQQQFSWTELLSDLGEVLPWQVRVVSVSPSSTEEGLTLAMTVVSRERGAFLELLDNLVADPRFGKPQPISETQPEAGRSIDYVFRLTATYVPGAGTP